MERADDSISSAIKRCGIMETQRLPASGRKEKAHTNNVIHCCGYSLMCRNFIYVKCTSGYHLTWKPLQCAYNRSGTGHIFWTSFMDDLRICKIRKDIDQELVKRRKRQGRRICAAAAMKKPCHSSIDLAGILQDVWYPKNFMRHSQSG